jgi:hypothetical protein
MSAGGTEASRLGAAEDVLLDHEPTDEEILKAVPWLNCSEPGDTGVAEAEWKTLMADDERRDFVCLRTCGVFGEAR